MAKRVLLVDDDPDLRRISRRLLERAGYEIRELESAANLELVIHDYLPDLILSDIMMPGRDGLAVCKELRANAETAGIPIVLFSAKSFEGDKRAALDAGATAYLVKPFTPAELVETVTQALSTSVSVRIWGCRGSIATPDLASGKYGGNTSCVELILPGNKRVIFDAGTGIRPLGNSLIAQSPLRTALMITHYHWDHMQGLPFFKPLFQPGNEITIYGPAESSEALVETMMKHMGREFFPVSIEAFRASVKYVGLGEETFEAFGARFSTLYTLHPGRTLAYRVDVGDRSLVYAPDNELLPEFLEPEMYGEPMRLARFAAGASLLIHDSAYSRDMYEKRRGWGHSSGRSLAFVAAEAGVRQVLLTHHDPDSEDAAVERVHREFQDTLAALGKHVPGEPAREGATIELQAARPIASGTPS